MCHRFKGRKLKWWVPVAVSTIAYVILINLFVMATGADKSIIILGSFAGFISAGIQEGLK